MAHRRTLYVAGNGDDRRGVGTAANPWKTIESARSFIHANGWNQNMTEDLVVDVSGHAWDISRPAVFTEADSGSNGYYVRYVNTGSLGTASMRGGRRLTGWVVHSGSIYKVPCPSRVSTLFENGVRARQARLPKWNPGVGFESAYAPYFHSVVNASPTVLKYDDADFDPAAWDPNDVEVVIWSSLQAPEIDWFTDTHGAPGIDTTAKTLTLTDKVKFYTAANPGGSRYFVQGDLSMLTDPGEFVWHAGWLYYRARDGAIADQEIVAPLTKDLVRLCGNDTDNPVSYVQFDGIEFFYGDFDRDYRFGTKSYEDQSEPWDYGYQQQNPNVRHGLIYLENFEHIKVTRCHVKNSGFAGIYMRERGRFCTFQDTWVERAGTSCIYVEGRAPGLGDLIGDLTFWNLKLTQFGELAGDGSGIHINQSGNNVGRYIHIEGGPRYGLELTGWGHSTHPNYTTGCNFSYFLIKDVGADSGDMGALTCNFMDRTGVNYFNQFIINGVIPHASMANIAGNGVFCDNESDGQHLSNGLVTNVPNIPMRVNDSAGHVLTNCSFLADGNVNPSFNPALVDTANIGVTADFPF